MVGVLDAVIVGGGHNGLTAAAVLARAGRRVVLLERRSVLGGACVTEEVWPGYHTSRAAYVAGLVRPVVLRELELARHGLRFLPRDPASITPLPDGRVLVLGGRPELSRASIAQFSEADARRYGDYEAWLERVAGVIEPLLDARPPDPARPRLRDLGPLGRTLRGLWRVRGELAETHQLVLGAARPLIERWFESEPLRGTLLTDALIGAFAGPSSPGTGYVLLHHVMGETGGARGVWAYVEGGMGRLSEALASAAREYGAELRVEAPVAEIRVEESRVRGVRLEDGSVVEARTVLSGVDPKRTFLDLLTVGALPADAVREVRALDFRSPVVKINLALDRLPPIRVDSTRYAGPLHGGTIHLGAQDTDALERSYRASLAGELPEIPMIEMTVPSALDPSLAPPGHHTASLFVQHVPPEWDEARWAQERDGFADRVFTCIETVAPGFTDSVLEREVLAPPDLERIFGLTGGNIFHGAMTPERLLWGRPAPWAGRYQTPVHGLYLCGAGAHPGGGVMGACGRNAALEVLRDAAD